MVAQESKLPQQVISLRSQRLVSPDLHAPEEVHRGTLDVPDGYLAGEWTLHSTDRRACIWVRQLAKKPVFPKKPAATKKTAAPKKPAPAKKPAPTKKPAPAKKRTTKKRA